MALGGLERTRTTSVVIADDHAVVRDGLRLLLGREEDLHVVDATEDLSGTVQAVRRCRPNVLLLDLNLRGKSSLKALGDLREASPQTAIVILTMQENPAYAREALRLGALGYMLKDAPVRELLDAIRLAAQGRTYLQPELGAKLATETQSTAQPKQVLSRREREVLRLVALGYTNQRIAEQLFLSVRTVESHRAHMQKKLNTTTRSDLVRHALDERLIEL